MRVNDQIWPHASICREWHVNVRPQLRANTLLPMSAAELVTNYGVSYTTQTNVRLQKDQHMTITKTNLVMLEDRNAHFQNSYHKILFEFKDT